MSLTEENYKDMIYSFRIVDLHMLLADFSINLPDDKSQLRNQALELLRNKSACINYRAFKDKINETYRLMLTESHTNNKRRSTLENNNQKIMSIGKPLPNFFKLNQQSTQNPQQFINILPPPRIQKVVNRNIFSRSNNFQYDYIPIDPRYVVTPVVSNQQGKTVAVDNSTYMNSTNSFIPSIQSLANVRLKKLPFYEDVAEVIKLSTLIGRGNCSISNIHEGMKEAKFMFTLSPLHTTYITMNRDISNGKNEYVYQLHIRICLFEPNATELTDYFPLGLNIRVCNEVCPLPTATTNKIPSETEARRNAQPINCTELVKLNYYYANTINVMWTPDEKTYVMGIYIVKKLTSEKLLQKLIDKGSRSSEETKNYIKTKLKNSDPDLTTISYRFSLFCPIGKKKMKFPAKSTKCDHLQCFDAYTFILMNEKKPTWMCPTCNQPCLYEDILIESYFLEVILHANLPDNCKEIEILENGTWKICEERKKEFIDIGAHVKEKPIVFVNLDGGDDKKSVEVIKEHINNPKSSRENKNIQPCLIDLTVSDDEEFPKKEQ